MATTQTTRRYRKDEIKRITPWLYIKENVNDFVTEAIEVLIEKRKNQAEQDAIDHYV